MYQIQKPKQLVKKILQITQIVQNKAQMKKLQVQLKKVIRKVNLQKANQVAQIRLHSQIQKNQVIQVIVVILKNLKEIKRKKKN